jgi:hypothetical protein
MATGEDAEGKPVKSVMTDMPALLTDAAIRYCHNVSIVMTRVQ